MKRIALYTVFALLLLVGATALAQDDIVPVTTTTTTFDLQSVIVTCPDESIALPVLEQAQLILNFREIDDVLVVPDGEITTEDGNLVIRTTEIRFSCKAPDEAALLVDRSPAVGLNETPPRDGNLEGLPESQSGYVVVDTDNANLRSCDNPTCTVVGIVDGGDDLFALGRNADDSWWYVRNGDLTGWIWGELIVLRGDLSDVPFVRTQGEPTPPSFYVGFTGNPLYAGAYGQDGIVCTIEGDTFYPLLGRAQEDGEDTWYLIEATCQDGVTATGWIDAEVGLVRNTGLVPVPIIR